jgi:hypothetical protein
MDVKHPNSVPPDAAAGADGQAANPYLAPTTAPLAPPIDRAALKEKSSVKATDFLHVAMAMKACGFLLLLPGLLFLFAVPLIGLALLALPVAFIVIGFGLDAFKPWAWMAAVLLVVPLAVLTACGAFAMIIRSEGVSSLSLTAFAPPVIAGYIAWTLLSHSGRQRYRSVIEAKRRQSTRTRWSPTVDEILADPNPQADPEQTPNLEIGSN